MVKPAPRFSNSSRVAEHADGAVDGRKFAARNTDRLLVVDAELEAGWAPLDEVEGSFGLEGCDGGAAVARDDVAAVEERDGHVLAVAGVADDHLVVWLEAWDG